MTATNTLEKLIILDRDGVINRNKPDYVRTPDEWIPLEGSVAAMASLHKHGYRIAIASNQSAVGRGIMSVEELMKVHTKMRDILSVSHVPIDGLFFCPHPPGAGCVCRKPQPGLLNDIAARYHRSLDGVLFVGDTLRDVQAAVAAGAQPVLVRTGLGAHEVKKAPPEVPVYENLAAVVRERLGLPCDA